MNKRLLLALVLSSMVLFGWSTVISKLYHVEKTTVTNQTPSSSLIEPAAFVNASVNPSSVSSLPLSETVKQPQTLWTMKQDNFEIVFNENSGAIQESFFKNYQSYKFSLGSGLLLKDFDFEKKYADDKKVIFAGQDQEKRITKEFHFVNNSYIIELAIEVQNIGSRPLKISLPLLLGATDPQVKTNTDPRGQQLPLEVVASLKEKNLFLNSNKSADFSGVKFVALKERYFCLIAEPEIADYSGYIHKLDNKVTEIGLNSPDFEIVPGQQVRHKFHIYLGPQDLRILKSAKPEWASIMHYGTFDFIAQLLLQILNAIYSVVHNWGWAIILLSVLIYLVLFPLSLKQMRSMKAMQALQPHMEELRKEHKDNPQKLNKELMLLYKEHKVNPLGGCLPFILQIPIFFALYRVLLNSVLLKGAKFLWIRDLSGPDKLALFGKEINILPIVMAGLMFFQQKMTASGTGQKVAEQQRMMTFMFPILFGFMFYSMPAGLVLYWLVNSFLMLLNQIVIQRKK